MVSSPPMKMCVCVCEGGGGVFFRASEGLPFPMDSGGGTIRNFPGETPVPISYPIDQCRTQVCQTEFNKLLQRSL